MPDIRHCDPSSQQDYAYLHHANAADLAWEWLRRDVAYRSLTPSPGSVGPFGCQLSSPASADVQDHWGTLNVAAADMGADATQLLWSAAADPSVLAVAALPARGFLEATFDLSQWAGRVTVIRNLACEHVLVRAAGGQVRFDVFGGTILNGPVHLFIDIDRPDALAQSPRLLRLKQSEPGDDLTQSLPKLNRAHLRHVLALRTIDALERGASIREVALALYGKARVSDQWLAPDEALKSTCRRLIAFARHMRDGGYRDLLATSEVVR